MAIEYEELKDDQYSDLYEGLQLVSSILARRMGAWTVMGVLNIGKQGLEQGLEQGLLFNPTMEGPVVKLQAARQLKDVLELVIVKLEQEQAAEQHPVPPHKS